MQIMKPVSCCSIDPAVGTSSFINRYFRCMVGRFEKGYPFHNEFLQSRDTPLQTRYDTKFTLDLAQTAEKKNEQQQQRRKQKRNSPSSSSQ